MGRMAAGNGNCRCTLWGWLPGLRWAGLGGCRGVFV